METSFSLNKSTGRFGRPRATISLDRSQIWPKFELILAVLEVLIACIYEDREKVDTA